MFIELISNTPQSAPQGVSRRARGRARCLCVDYCKWLASLMSSHQPLEPPAVTSYLMVIIWKASVWKMYFFFFPRFRSWLTELSKCHCGQSHTHSAQRGNLLKPSVSMDVFIVSFKMDAGVFMKLLIKLLKMFHAVFILLVLWRGIQLGYILKLLCSIKPEPLNLIVQL